MEIRLINTVLPPLAIDSGKSWPETTLFLYKKRTWCEVSGAVSLDSNVMFELVCEVAAFT